MNKNSITFYTLCPAISTYNKDNLVIGWHNPPLANEGILQAKRLNLFGYDIISSDQLYCTQTIQAAGISEYEIDCRLRDIKLGSYEGQSINYIKELELNPLDYYPPNGESYRLAYYRLSSLLFELFYRLQVKPDTRYLLCTDKNIIRILKTLEFKPSIEDFLLLTTNNCHISRHNLSIADFYYLSKYNN